MKDQIEKLLDQLKSIIDHDTYMLSYDDIDSITWKIDKLKDEILETYKNKNIV